MEIVAYLRSYDRLAELLDTLRKKVEQQALKERYKIINLGLVIWKVSNWENFNLCIG